jgi:hypothetical protein
MSRYGRSADERRLEIAYAIGQGRDIVEHFRSLARARGWSSCR